MSGYIGPTPVPQATQTRQSFTATANQTSFATLGYEVGHLSVYLNGVKLNSADFAATNSSDIVLAAGCTANDILEMVAFSTFEVTDGAGLLTSIKTVDGATSGLDADLLDGQHGAYYAPIASPALTGNPTAPTQAESDDSTKVATTAYVSTKLTTLIGGAPSTLNDLNELAAAINDDANYNSTLTTALATKLPLAGGAITGDVTFGDNNKAAFGAGSDLQIYHSGTNSVIDNNTGHIYIRNNVDNDDGSNIYIQGKSGENSIVINDDSNVELYFDNALKLATTSFGAQITGSLAVDTITNASSSTDVTIDTNFDIILDAANVGIGTASPTTNYGKNLNVHSSATNGAAVHLTDGTTGNSNNDGFHLITTGGLAYVWNRESTDMVFATSNTERMRIDSSGNAGIIQDLNIGNNDSSNPLSKLRFGATQYGAADIRPSDEGAHKVGLDFYTDGTGDATINPTFAMRINSSGNVGIGTLAPVQPLHIASSTTSRIQMTNNASGSTSNDGYAIGMEGTTRLYHWLYENSYMSFATNNTERMRISSAGIVTKPQQPSFAATRSAGHVPNSTYYVANVVYHNTGNHYNASTGTFTAPVSGLYSVATNFMTSSEEAEGNQFYEIRLNNGAFQQVYDTGYRSGFHYRFSWAGNVSLSQDDTVRVYTNNVKLYGAGNVYSYFSVSLLG